MENRSVYLRVLERAHLQNISVDNDHPHSFLASQLRLGVLESGLYFQLNTAYMTAWASITSHSNIDIAKALNTFGTVYQDVKNTIPFMKHNERGISSDMQNAIDQYKKMEQRELEEKENAGSKPKQ